MIHIFIVKICTANTHLPIIFEKIMKNFDSIIHKQSISVQKENIFSIRFFDC